MLITIAEPPVDTYQYLDMAFSVLMQKKPIFLMAFTNRSDLCLIEI